GVAHLQRPLEQADHLARERLGPALLGLLQLPGAPQRVRHALLVDGLVEAVVGRPAVVDQGAVPAQADHGDQGLGAALGVDVVAGRPVTHPAVQPGGLTPDPPARLVRRQALRLLQALADLLVGRPQPPPGPQHDLGAGPARQPDAEQGVEDAGDLAVGQAPFLVEHDHGGLGVGADLAGGGADRVAGLQRVPAPARPAAGAAAPAVDGEAAHDRVARDVGLELLVGMGLLDGAAAVGAGTGQRSVVGLVHLLGGRWRTVAVAAVPGAGFAARLLGVGLGGPLGEGCGLAFAGTEGLLELLAEFVAGTLESLQLLTQLLVLGQQLLVGGGRHPAPRRSEAKARTGLSWRLPRLPARGTANQ